MMYESRDEKRPTPCREKEKEKRDERGGRENPNVAVALEVVWRQPTSPSGRRHRDSLLGEQRAIVNEINLLKIN